MVAAREVVGGGNRELVLNMYRVSVLQDKNSSGDRLHSNENVFNSTEMSI